MKLAAYKNDMSPFFLYVAALSCSERYCELCDVDIFQQGGDLCDLLGVMLLTGVVEWMCKTKLIELAHGSMRCILQRQTAHSGVSGESF